MSMIFDPPKLTIDQALAAIGVLRDQLLDAREDALRLASRVMLAERHLEMVETCFRDALLHPAPVATGITARKPPRDDGDDGEAVHGPASFPGGHHAP
ncbi:MAG: hypothetical protein LBO79_03350 [Zoogloeaceae bacterium]|nr:hypothetical protein [Zoogloeaceae bacterium]